MNPSSCPNQFIVWQQRAVKNKFQEKELSHKCSTLVFERFFVAPTATVYRGSHFLTRLRTKGDQKKLSRLWSNLTQKFNPWNLWVDLTEHMPTQFARFYLNTCSNNLWLAFHASVQQGKALTWKALTWKARSENVATLCLTARLHSTMPIGNAQEAPKIGTPCYRGKMLILNSVRLRGVSLYAPKVYGINEGISLLTSDS